MESTKDCPSIHRGTAFTSRNTTLRLPLLLNSSKSAKYLRNHLPQRGKVLTMIYKPSKQRTVLGRIFTYTSCTYEHGNQPFWADPTWTDCCSSATTFRYKTTCDIMRKQPSKQHCQTQTSAAFFRVDLPLPDALSLESDLRVWPRLTA